MTGRSQKAVPEVHQGLDLAEAVLRLLNRGSGSMSQLIREVLRMIAESTGFEAVGLRLKRGNDYPYYEQKGFSNDFLYRENYLCSRLDDGTVALDDEGRPVLECMCGLILMGKATSDQPFFTEGGSFWINNTSDVLSLPRELDPRANPRNQCIHSGYRTVALIPVHSGREIIGMLQLNDRRENMLSHELVHSLESLGDQIGMAIQRKQAEEALRQSQSDLKRAQSVGQIGSWRLNVEHDVLTWSDENHRIFGIPKGMPMTYETFLSTVYEEDRQYVDDHWQAALAGAPYDIEHRIWVDDQIKWVREKAYLEFDDDGKLLGGFGITQDISRSKQAEEELRMFNESLERLVAERSVVAEYRAEQLQKLTLELTLAEQRERQRLAMVLHDGLQQILVASKIQLGFVERNENIHQAVEQVKGLIDDAIETSRSLTAELSPPILMQGDLKLACEWLVRWMRNKYGLRVHLKENRKVSPPAEEIKLLLFQALRELLFNVVKHAGVQEAFVQISDHEGCIEAIVEDKGIGFNPADLRAEGGRSGGVGLFGIRERLTYFGGRMEIESAPGKGSRFRMALPNSIIPAESKNPAQSRPPAFILGGHPGRSKSIGANRKIRVLLVDDHVVMRQGLSKLLRSEPDMEVIGEAVDGEAALEKAGELKPDVVLMDINMPGLGGVESTRRLHRKFPWMRIIGLSMFEENEQTDAMKKAGAVSYISKSSSSDAVLDAIRRSIDKSPDSGT
ncbi:MAG: response regulator [Acidobacteriota bacterium]